MALSLAQYLVKLCFLYYSVSRMHVNLSFSYRLHGSDELLGDSKDDSGKTGSQCWGQAIIELLKKTSTMSQSSFFFVIVLFSGNRFLPLP